MATGNGSPPSRRYGCRFFSGNFDYWLDLAWNISDLAD